MLHDTLATLGLAMPSSAALVQTAVAAGIVVVALAAGWFAGARLAIPLADLWRARVGGQVEGLAPRLGKMLRHGLAALILAIANVGWPWQTLASLLIGLVLGLAVARLLIETLRGLHLPRWTAWMVGGIALVAIMANALGGFDVVTRLLEQVGFDIGKRRFSLLALVTVLVTLVLLYAGVRLVNRIVGHSIAQTRGFDPTQKLLAQKLAGIAVVVAAFFLGIDLLDIDLTTFAVFSGALGLAVGFGLQKTVGNLIAGIILLMDRSIKPGDVIVVGESFGWVNKIGVRAVSIITRDGKEHLIPNENLMTQEVENWSFSDRNVRVHIPVGIAYDSDVALAQSLMLRAALESPRVLSDPKPNVWMTGYGDYALQHDILVWIGDPEGGVGNVQSDVLNRLWVMFRDHGVHVPVPQREVVLRDRRESGPTPP